MQNLAIQEQKKILENLSIVSLNPMQLSVIEKATTSQNLIVVSPTGSGKTIAFLLPLITSLKPNFQFVQALIICPTRELSIQIEQVLKKMKIGFKVSCCYGGHSFKVEQNNLLQSPAIIVGTPGRIADHINRKTFDPSGVKQVVLDEFDKSLQMGFHEQLKVIFNSLNQIQKHTLTSATSLNELPDFLPFSSAETLTFGSDEMSPNLTINLVKTESAEKMQTLLNLLSGFNQEPCLVFCNHKDAVNRISELLSKSEVLHTVFHGDLEQIDREKNLIKFRLGTSNILIATDLAARGIDIPEIKHIVHYQLPVHLEEFIHRNGRTARMHASGKAYLLIAHDESLPSYASQIKYQEMIPSPRNMVQPKFACIYLSAGKKDKISKADILGFLIKMGKLETSQIGLIAILDYATYVAVESTQIQKMFENLKNQKLKKQKIKVELAT